MNIKKSYSFLVLLSIFFIICMAPSTIKAVTADEVLSSKKDDIQSSIDNTNEELEQIGEEINTVSDEVQELNERISTYQNEVAALNVEIAQLELSINDAIKKLETTEQEYIKQRKLFETRVVAIYEAGNIVYLDVLLKSKNIADFISRYFYLNEISSYDERMLDNIEKQKNDIEAQKNALEGKQAQLKVLAQNKENTAVTLSNIKIIRNNYLSNLNQIKDELQQKLEIYEADMEELEKKMLQFSLESLGEDYVGGNFIWPLPEHYTITSPFGMRIHPIFKVRRMHTGTDISAPTGTPIVAANAGVVVTATFASSYGNYIMIDHGGGVITLYAHASKLLVSEGDIVEQGDIIMETGSTGWSTGPHLHFEIRIDGSTVDPLPYILDTESEEDVEYDDTIDAVS